ncbi:bifunctional riboflavin kinase/FAD synthetase [Pelagibacterium luteolum]|uniref:Riboflavin biosynthesis protein n=1 Tax=Pelagibacterium luteolum TaxID=440168 RepID=A0A1G7U0L5_9HYPH|nr:bifunctional riboflavin kinase/FAD synthetase [Pelagibacterium luteolum]SDG40871.1 riboflavin kinase / FMN adenylyltransferase [Pelagibacterium luteolum]
MTSGAPFIRLDGLSDVPHALRGGVVAIGNFDGFHRGHQQVFAAARDMAKTKGVPAIVLTFEPHPRDVFAPNPFLFRLTYADQKAKLAEASGFDAIVVMEFSRDLAGVEATEFVSKFLIDALQVSGVVVGADFHFGKARAGTPDFLQQQGDERGFSVRICDMLEDEAKFVSSSRIREALGGGDVALANHLLGYHWTFSGEIVTGDKRGRELGYPTANMAVPATFSLAQGVYAVKIRIEGELFDGVAAFGKPMFDNTRPPFETFIFDFDRDIYGQTIEVALIAFIRGQLTFDGLDPLIAQMNADSETARITTAQARPLTELDAALGLVSGQ